jgi:hypothetical protein
MISKIFTIWDLHVVFIDYMYFIILDIISYLIMYMILYCVST